MRFVTLLLLALCASPALAQTVKIDSTRRDSLYLITKAGGTTFDSARVEWRYNGATIVRRLKANAYDTTKVLRAVSPTARADALTLVYHTYPKAKATSYRVGARVVQPAPVTPPVAPDSFTPNLPTNAGLRLITDSRFVNMVEGRANADGLVFYWSGRNAIDESAPYGANVFETWYPGNDAGNGIGGANITSALGNRWRRVYFAIMLWVPLNYVIHTNTEKFFYPIITTNGVMTGSAPVNMLSKDYNPTGPSFGFGMIPGPGHTMEWQDSNVFVQKGKWSLVEMDLQMNTPGNYDASWRVWVDGRLAGDRSGMMFSYTTATQSYFDAIRFDGTRGGGASSVLTPPGGQVRRYNRLVFYAQ